MRKRYKLLLIIFISFLLVIFIYYICNKRKMMYVALGDNLSYNKFPTYNYAEQIKYLVQREDIIYYDFLDDEPIVDSILSSIKQNTKGINYVLKNANLITLCISDYELNNYKDLNNNMVKNYLDKVYELISVLYKYNSNIVLVLLYRDNYTRIQQEIQGYALDLKVKVISDNLVSSNNVLYTDKKVYLNLRGHKIIAETLVKKYINQK